MKRFLGLVARHGPQLAFFALTTLVFVVAMAATAGLAGPLLVALGAGALTTPASILVGGFVSGAAGYLLTQHMTKKPATWRQALTVATVSGLLSLTTVGLARLATPFLAPVIARTVPEAVVAAVPAGIKTAAGGATAGSALAASVRLAENVHDKRPLLDGVGEAAILNGIQGAVMSALPSGVGAPAPNTRGITGALALETPRPQLPIPHDHPAPVAASPVAPPPANLAPISPRAPPDRPLGGYASVHEAPPAWLEDRFQKTVDAVAAGKSVPGSDPAQVRAFIDETYEHVNEVNLLTKALGGRPREIPTAALAPEKNLVGIHDLGERSSLRHLEQLLQKFEATPLRDRAGNEVPVPAWLRSLVADARAAGETSVDVSKLNPYVASGLARNGPPDPYSIAVHNLSPHHAVELLRGNNLIESIADRVNAMRQVRIYRAQPMPFEKIGAILKDQIAKGELPPEAAPLVDRALAAEHELELSGNVNPYHLAGRPE